MFPLIRSPFGLRISLSKVKNILAFASDDHAKAFLAFHGLQIVIDKAPKKNWDLVNSEFASTTFLTRMCVFSS